MASLPIIIERGASLHAPDEARVVIAHRGMGPGGVVLQGDVEHWLAPLPLAAVPGGGDRHELELRLAPGVYAYKLRTADGQWRLHADNPRTRSVDGQRNSALVVGGTDEPLLHAPVPPWL